MVTDNDSILLLMIL